jgi:hypothetical protein
LFVSFDNGLLFTDLSAETASVALGIVDMNRLFAITDSRASGENHASLAELAIFRIDANISRSKAPSASLYCTFPAGKDNLDTLQTQTSLYYFH